MGTWSHLFAGSLNEKQVSGLDQGPCRMPCCPGTPAGAAGRLQLQRSGPLNGCQPCLGLLSHGWSSRQVSGPCCLGPLVAEVEAAQAPPGSLAGKAEGLQPLGEQACRGQSPAGTTAAELEVVNLHWRQHELMWHMLLICTVCWGHQAYSYKRDQSKGAADVPTISIQQQKHASQHAQWT